MPISLFQRCISIYRNEVLYHDVVQNVINICINVCRLIYTKLGNSKNNNVRFIQNILQHNYLRLNKLLSATQSAILNPLMPEL